jgi:hypothetical protein
MRQGISTSYRRGHLFMAEANPTRDMVMVNAVVQLNGDRALAVEANHTRAAKACAEKLGWSGLWVGGGNAAGDGFHYVNLPLPDASTFPLLSRIGADGVDWFIVPAAK